MFEVTIKGDSMSALASAVVALAGQFQTTASYEADDAAREALQAKRTARKPKPEPQPEPEVADDEADWTDEQVEPMPETAKAIVDAGTGKPAPAAKAEADAPIKMTFNDVKAAAAKLAAKDTPQLAAILKKYKAAKISEVPGPQLGEFASDVMEALG